MRSYVLFPADVKELGLFLRVYSLVVNEKAENHEVLGLISR